MRDLKCWPGAIAQVTRVLNGTDEEQLLGKVVKTMKLGVIAPTGPCWVLESPLQVTFTRRSQNYMNGTVFEVGETALVSQLPDAYLTPFKPLNELEEKLEDSELDIEHSFPAPKEPEHA